jgi:hypothetical protein
MQSRVDLACACDFLTQLIGALLIAMLGWWSPALATDALDVSVGLKTLPLLSNRIIGQINMAVAFDAARPESRMDAEAIKAAVDSGLDVPGGERLTAMTVAAEDLPKLKGATVIFLAKDIGPDALRVVAQSAAANGILSISTDVACVRANECVLGIVSRPTVEIYFSRAAAAASHLGFTSAFIMLAKPN